MLPTPKAHLPKGYPLPDADDGERHQPVFSLAFKIHEVACLNPTRHLDIISPIRGRSKTSHASYCDCYEKAYRIMKDAGKI